MKLSHNFFAVLLCSVVILCHAARAHGQSDFIVVLGDKTTYGCLLRTKGNVLVSIAANSAGKVLNFKVEKSRIARAVKFVDRNIIKFKRDIRALKRKKKSPRIEHKILKKQATLELKVRKKARLRALIVEIENCAADKVAAQAVCGNGVLESGEICDGNCPTSCPSAGCNQITLQGSASSCDAKCISTGSKTVCASGDGCCPSGCNANNDSDCAPKCGNSSAESGELCDGADFSGKTCLTEGYVAGQLVCTAQCLVSTSSCIACVAGLTNCSNTCVNLASDSNNCGGCGKICTAAHGTRSCDNGSCGAIQCSPTYANCDSNSANGCEISLSNDSYNCGSCGHSCVTTNGIRLCSSGTCATLQCNSGFKDCDGDGANGCETSVTTLNNCVGCGITCGGQQNTTASCASGVCAVGSCFEGFCDANKQNNDGCEYNLNTDPSCASATAIKSDSGELFSGNEAGGFIQVTDFGEKYYSIKINDTATVTKDLLIDFNFFVPNGTNYDLDVWCKDCANTIPFTAISMASNKTDGLVYKSITVRRKDLVGIDRTFSVYLRVRFVLGDVCTPWKLDIQSGSGTMPNVVVCDK